MYVMFYSLMIGLEVSDIVSHAKVFSGAEPCRRRGIKATWLNVSAYGHKKLRQPGVMSDGLWSTLRMIFAQGELGTAPSLQALGYELRRQVDAE